MLMFSFLYQEILQHTTIEALITFALINMHVGGSKFFIIMHECNAHNFPLDLVAVEATSTNG